PLLRVERGELVELRPPLRLLRVHAVDGVQADQRVVLVPPTLALAVGAHRTGDGVPAAQTVLADLRHGDVHVVGPGEVATGPDERVVVEHVEDAGDRHEHIVLGDLGLAFAGGRGTLAPAAPAVAVAATPAAPAAAVTVLVGPSVPDLAGLVAAGVRAGGTVGVAGAGLARAAGVAGPGRRPVAGCCRIAGCCHVAGGPAADGAPSVATRVPTGVHIAVGAARRVAAGRRRVAAGRRLRPGGRGPAPGGGGPGGGRGARRPVGGAGGVTVDSRAPVSRSSNGRVRSRATRRAGGGAGHLTRGRLARCVTIR